MAIAAYLIMQIIDVLFILAVIASPLMNPAIRHKALTRLIILMSALSGVTVGLVDYIFMVPYIALTASLYFFYTGGFVSRGIFAFLYLVSAATWFIVYQISMAACYKTHTECFYNFVEIIPVISHILAALLFLFSQSIRSFRKANNGGNTINFLGLLSRQPKPPDNQPD